MVGINRTEDSLEAPLVTLLLLPQAARNRLTVIKIKSAKNFKRFTMKFKLRVHDVSI